MSRLLTLIFAMIFFVAMQPALSSDQFLELAAPKKVNLEVIGTVPPKRHIDLDLGKLRTENARLPDGERDLEARKRLRVRRSLARQRAVTNAKRNKTEEIAREKSDSKDASNDGKEGEAKSDAIEKSDGGESELARAEKPKIIKSYKDSKKKRKKSSGSGSGNPPAFNPNATGQVSIE